MKNMEQELIRKAAEAMHAKYLRTRPDVAKMAAFNVPFEKLPKLQQGYAYDMAEAALKVFYEHTHAQPRERKPPCCADCGANMAPTPAGAWKCNNCGSTSGAV